MFPRSPPLSFGEVEFDQSVDRNSRGPLFCVPSVPAQSTVFVVNGKAEEGKLLSSQLAAMGFDLQLFGTATEFWQTFNPLKPGCLLFDGRSTIDGVSLLDRLAAEPLSPPVIYLSDETDAATVVRVMKAGAVDFLQQRTFTGTDLWEAVQRGLFTDQERRSAYENHQNNLKRISALSDSERQVLELLLLGKSNREIATELGIGTAAVEGRRTRLMKKLGVDNLVALVRFAIAAHFPHGPRSDR